MRLLFSFISVLVAVSASDFHEHCRETLRQGRQTVEDVSLKLSHSEKSRLSNLIHKSKILMRETDGEVRLSKSFQQLILVDDEKECPQPNNTIMTTTAKPQPTTTVLPTTAPAATSQAASSTVANTVQAAASSAAPTAAPPQLEDDEADEPHFKVPHLYTHNTDEDPFSRYMSTLHYYMKREDDVCNNKMTDLNSLTEDQLFGYFSTLATTHPGPFCSLCHRLTEEIQSRVFVPNKLLAMDDEYHIHNLFYSHVPTAKTICSAIAPGCHDNYDSQIRNLTESVICLECTGCMAVTNVIQHKFLLQPKAVNQVYAFLRGNLFHNLCAELCMAFKPYNLTIFPNGFSYDACQAVLETKYLQVIEVATVILRPERLCSLELQWCELNEQPNAIHCLRELCQEYFKDTPQTRWLCSQIPDRPEQADAYLNIRQTKIYKEKKDYHMEFEQRQPLNHDEL